MTRSAIIVDDERLARRELATLLKAHPELHLAGEASSVDEAAALVRAVDPDVIFLDIQMPRRSGFELLEAADLRGRVVFVTAHDVHALRAFEVNALDYLLKPVHPTRLAVTVERLLTALDARDRENLSPPPSPSSLRFDACSDRGDDDDETPAPASPPARVPDSASAAPLLLDDHLFLSEGRAARFVRVRSIVCIRGAGDYSELILADGKRLLSPRPLKEWEARLPPQSFLRVHRTAIVHLDHVDTVSRVSDQAFHLSLRGLPEPVPLSRRHAARFKAMG